MNFLFKRATFKTTTEWDEIIWTLKDFDDALRRPYLNNYLHIMIVFQNIQSVHL